MDFNSEIGGQIIDLKMPILSILSFFSYNAPVQMTEIVEQILRHGELMGTVETTRWQ